jgi:tetratricopeptide (TPR) repeat protein/DNA-binding MarR family transcriptional regulator
MAGQSFLPTEILDYVETHAPPEGSPYGVSQRELAKALGYHPCSMSRPLDELVREGELACKRGLVRDGIRRQLVYRLTERGRSRLARETKRVPLLAGAIPAPPNPFLGRREELDRLAEFARSGGAVVIVDGPPGMGKTALMSRHLRRVKRGRIPFWYTARPASSPRQFLTALSHSLSFLGAPQLAYYAQLPRMPVAREVADLVRRALGDRELVAVVDDFQMADQDLRRFLADFASALSQNRGDQIYLVGQESALVSDEELRILRLTIGGLDRAAAHDLTDRRGGLAERFESVYQSTLGSPLLLQLAVSNPGLEADAATLPARVVERLSPDDLRALLPIAVSNEPLPSRFVSEQIGMSASRLAEVASIGIVQRTAQDRLEIAQVVRNALLRRVTAKEEKAAHLALAEYYSGSHQAGAIRERFLHLVSAGDWKVAAQSLAQQERQVLALGYSETLRAALRSLVSATPRGPSRVRILLIEAAILRLHSDYSEAIDTIRQAIEDCNGDPKVTAEGLLTIVEILSRLHRVEEATRDMEEAERIGPVSRRIQAFLLLSRARIVRAEGDMNRARTMFHEAYELARRFRVTDLALEGIAAWSGLEEVEGDPELALRIIERALPDARQAGRPDIAFNLRLIRAKAYMRRDDNQAAEEEMRLVRAEAESLGYLNQLTYALSGLAASAIKASRWNEAVAYAKQAGTLAERLRNDMVLGHSLALLATAELRQGVVSSGDPELIRDSVLHGERSVEVLSRLPPSESLGYAHGYLGESYLASGDRVRATMHYNSALGILEKLKLFWLRDAFEAELGPKLGLSAHDGDAQVPGAVTKDS